MGGGPSRHPARRWAQPMPHRSRGQGPHGPSPGLCPLLSLHYGSDVLRPPDGGCVALMWEERMMTASAAHCGIIPSRPAVGIRIAYGEPTNCNGAAAEERRGMGLNHQGWDWALGKGHRSMPPQRCHFDAGEAENQAL